MRTMLLAAAVSLAAMVLPAAPAQAQVQSGSVFHAGSMGAADRGFRDGRHDGRNDRRDRRRSRDSVVIGDWGWYGDRDWAAQNNWDPNSYNDWWHDRPDRSFPRWVQSNQNCERVWWSGGGWRC